MRGFLRGVVCGGEKEKNIACWIYGTENYYGYSGWGDILLTHTTVHVLSLFSWKLIHLHFMVANGDCVGFFFSEVNFLEICCYI